MVSSSEEGVSYTMNKRSPSRCQSGLAQKASRIATAGDLDGSEFRRKPRLDWPKGQPYGRVDTVGVMEEACFAEELLHGA